MQYQVGGSLAVDATSYIPRHADQHLYTALKAGEFCYVLNSRQMGKSSLLVRTRTRLQAEGYRCATLDLTNIGSDQITPLQWYKGMAKDLWRAFKLMRAVKFKSWWEGQEDVSLVQRLSQFLRDVVLEQFPDENLVIFLDEIDSVLSLPFGVDDFFAMIRFCHNQRANDPAYQRLNFAIFGVATPGDLIRDRTRTPFNIGTPIALTGFTLIEAAPLAQGLNITNANTSVILQHILAWTDGQPFLTQKLCKLAVAAAQGAVGGQLTVPPGNEAYWVEQLVQQQVLHNWEVQDEPEHLRTIRNRLLNNPDTAGRLLGLYQQILRGDRHTSDDSQEWFELVLSGLVVPAEGGLRVKNRIYGEIFNLDWVNDQLNRLRPYSQMLQGWLASGQRDESRLLRGQALVDAQTWAQGKRLSDDDYQFLAAAVESDRAQVQQALEADRAQIVKAQLAQEQRANRLRSRLLWAIVGALLLSVGFGSLTFWQYRKAVVSEQSARRSEVEALISSAQGNFESARELEALQSAIRAKAELTTFTDLKKKSQLEAQLTDTLRTILYTIKESNRLTPGVAVKDVAWHPDGTKLAAGLVDGRIQFWGADGQKRKTIQAHDTPIRSLTFSHQGEFLLSGALDGTVKLWTANGDLVRQLVDHGSAVREAHFSPDDQTIASVYQDHTTQIWTVQGQELGTIPRAFTIAFLPDSQSLIATFRANPIRRYSLSGEQLEEFPSPPGASARLRVTADGQTIVLGTMNGNIWVMDFTGVIHYKLETHQAAVTDLDISADQRHLLSVSVDGVGYWWSLAKPNQKIGRGGRQDNDGTVLHPSQAFRGHQSPIPGSSIHPDSQRFATAGDDGTIRLWQSQNTVQQRFMYHTSNIIDLAWHPGETAVVSIAPTRTLRQWQWLPPHLKLDLALWTDPREPSPHATIAITPQQQQTSVGTQSGALLYWATNSQQAKILRTPGGPLLDLAVSADDQRLATASNDGIARLWQRQGVQWLDEPLMEFKGHESAINQIALHPQAQQLATASGDRTLKIWQLDGQLLHTLEGHDASVRTVAYSPDGRSLVSGSDDNTLILWDAVTGGRAQTFTGHQGAITDVVWHPQLNLIFSASIDGTIKLWQPDGQLLRTLQGHEAGVQTLLLAPDGQFLFSGGDDFAVMVWDLEQVLNLDEWAYGCQWLADYLQQNPDEQIENFCAEQQCHLK